MTRAARARSLRPAERLRAAGAAPPHHGVPEFFMRLALHEAAKGLGRTSPNPAVGAVIVKDGRVVGRGHHERAGGPHAEVVALRRAKGRAAGADLYTTLEPCDHFGKTPPCSLAVIEAGIRRVFVATQDPNPRVNGRGIARLRGAGVQVVMDVLREECEALNAPWFRYITSGRPYVTLKAAITLDGRIATRTGDSRWVTGEEARAEVHRLRDVADAVLVGAGTALADDPRLTARLPRGRGRDPVRVVLDSELKLPRRLALFHPSSSAPTLVAHVTHRAPRFGAGVEALRCRSTSDGHVDLDDLLTKLARRGVTHLLVEGGGQVSASFLRGALVDRIVLFVAPKMVGGDGIPWLGGPGVARMSDAIPLEVHETRRAGDDIVIVGTPVYGRGRRVRAARRR
ncbi:MAG TPA: bifunctional diaminohydroxyphosphoribosylaminopyrimidine deaminase/5-amino-6-(5-phosphoribosylamino)uracil reductase RibD [Anaeromyxobacteraceae bacterium]|nr:bifunctional diaminohydroxyphosphoribosylaminopyrimidine deaminase/5-amino-6-(5-phosphoribosylamino)uracil reductase RibD [Anaeromyxobacteraceae bacterium]